MRVRTGLERALVAFVLVFVLAHVAGVEGRRRRDSLASDDGHYWTLTLWVLLATALVVAWPRVPGCVASSVLAANVLVVALYYAVVNRGPVTGESFLRHGGCALALAALAATGAVRLAAEPATAALLTGLALALLAAGQRRWERRTGRDLYPGATLRHPGWRLGVLPVAGAVIAGVIAAGA